MLDLMAERGYGPMHIGKTIHLEAGFDFDRVAIVYYPGVDYFADLVSSAFYQRIFSNKQLGDSQAVITAPLTTLVLS